MLLRIYPELAFGRMSVADGGERVLQQTAEAILRRA